VNWLNHTKSLNLDPAEVDLDDDTYLVPNYSDLPPLIASIEKLGMINTPVVQENSDGCLRPLLGRRRLQASVALGIDSLEVHVVPPDMPVREGFLLAFWDNYSHRPFDEACTAVIVRKLLDLFPRDFVAAEFLPLLGVHPRGPRLEQLRAVGTLDREMLSALACRQIHEKTAAILAECDDEGQRILFDLIQDLGMNANKNADLVETIVDLAVFQERPIGSFIDDKTARDILRDRDIPRPQRAERFRDLLRSWRTPDLVEKENRFRQWQRSLPAVPGVVIRHTKAFEDDHCKIEISARSREEVEIIVAAIREKLI